jgi:hypothetical protein
VANTPTSGESQDSRDKQPADMATPGKGIAAAVHGGVEGSPPKQLCRWARFHRRLKEAGLHDLVTLLATVAIAVAGGVYTHYARKQWCAMQESNRINRAALESVQRAFVSLVGWDAKVMTEPSDSSKMAGITFYASWKNSGATPGTKATDWDNAVTIQSTLPKDFPFPDHDLSTGEEMAAGTGGPQHERYYPPQATVGAHSLWFTRKQIDEFQSGRRLHLYMYGWTRYHDIFPASPEHVTMFCYEVTRIASIPATQSTPPPTNLLISTEQCARHNCVDETCKGEPGYYAHARQQP